MLPLLPLLALLSLLTLPPPSLACAPTCSRTTRSCSLCYLNCQSFQFTSCTSTTGNNNRSQQLSQSRCLNRCCAVDGNITVFTANSAKMCTDVGEDEDKNEGNFLQMFGYYAIVVIGGIAGTVILVLVIREIYRRCLKTEPLRLSRRIRPGDAHHEPSHLNLDPQGSLTHIAQHPQLPQLSPHSLTLIQDLTNVCCICLDNQVNCIIKCGHVFHVECLVAWAKRRDVCPLCNERQMYMARVYCRGCWGGRATVDVRKGQGVPGCGTCQEKEKIGIERGKEKETGIGTGRGKDEKSVEQRGVDEQ